jgi:hypothetical protein
VLAELVGVDAGVERELLEAAAVVFAAPAAAVGEVCHAVVSLSLRPLR